MLFLLQRNSVCDKYIDRRHPVKHDMSGTSHHEEHRIHRSLPFPSLPSRATFGRLAHDPYEMINKLGIKTEAIAFRLASAASAQDFMAARKELYPKYFSLSMAISNIVDAEGPKRDTIKEISSASFDELEALFCGHTFASSEKDAILFCLFTLRRTYRLLDRIYAANVAKADRPEDAACGEEFTFHNVWVQLHINTLAIAIRRNIVLPSDVMACILDGMKACVTAYASVRHGVELREAPLSLDLSKAVWDDEDCNLTESSSDAAETLLNGW